MTDLRLYRAAFAPLFAALVVVAFSLDGVPEPLEPPPGTIAFDAAEAARNTRAVLGAGEDRPPGSAADSAAADLVRERFGEIVAGETQEQTLEASGPDGDVELRNVLITLPGQSDVTTLIVAGRDDLTSGPAGAAATGALIELASVLAIVERRRTVVLASTSGASLESEGSKSLVAALPDRLDVDSAIVLTRPGSSVLSEPHLLGQLPGPPPATLIETGVALLAERAAVPAGLPGAPAQLARLALPAATGQEEALGDRGIPAIAFSAAGGADTASPELDPEVLERFGSTVAGMVRAIDQSDTTFSRDQKDYVRIGDTIVRGWTLRLLALALLIPAAAVAAAAIARARRQGESLRAGFGWALEWWIPAVVALAAVWGLGVLGIVPQAGMPYEPRRIELGIVELLVLVLIGALVVSLWWVLGLRRLPPAPGLAALIGCAAGLIVSVCALLWIVNPYLALILTPLAHLGALAATDSARSRLWAPPIGALAAIPLAGALLVVAAALGWGAAAPWQVAALVAGGGIGTPEVVAIALAVTSACAVVRAATGTPSRRPERIPAPQRG